MADVKYVDTNEDGVINMDEIHTQSKYAEEREAILNGTSEKVKADYALKNNDYTAYLVTEYDKIKSDSDKDGKVSKTEYNNYIVYKEELGTSASTGNIQENNYDSHHYYHLDFSFYIVIGMLCITAIIFKLLHRKPYQ